MPSRLITLLTCLAICLVSGCQSEIAKWEFAEAQLQAEYGDRAAAIPWMKLAVEQVPDDPFLALELARELSEIGDPESVRICDRVWNEPVVQQSVEFRNYVQQLKIQFQQSSGDFGGALLSYKEFLSDHVARDENELNTLAYCRALAKQELRLADTNIKRALDVYWIVPGWQDGRLLNMQGKTAVAIALVARELEYVANQPTPIADSPSATAGKRLTKAREFLGKLIEEYEFDVLQLPTLDLDEDRVRAFKSALAMLLTVRALIYQDQGDSAACNQDRFRVKQLGFDADQMVQDLPAVNDCLALLQISAMYIDTLGFIQSQMPWKEPAGGWSGSNAFYEPRWGLTSDTAIESTPQEKSASQLTQAFQPNDGKFYSSYNESLGNLNLALEALKIYRLALCGQNFNRADYPVSEVRRLQVAAKKSEATLRYHRLMIHQRQGETVASEQDRQSILDLGFEPSDRLF